ncbi:unnamed protein product [Acanthoscelides obtectus]|uniref:Uncharacterized protein n=1 Tax=Acanthoscelides obtectus TaxID=200917 RepID=A0A9P0PNZ7_ACAOB|nr:unnamed protein product [Acanthoscelides obtectus]CAK1680609.1 hypothetical protein AOBTE_LOCUS32801 [Acanthoscelides obtectus]
MDNYSYWNYWKRALKLHELMAEIENIDDDELILDTIAVLKPVNANEYGSQLIEVEVVFENNNYS